MMLNKYKWLRNVDFLKVPHHGSRRNLNTSIIEDLSPKSSCISAAGNKKHPSGRLVYWLAKYGNVYSTLFVIPICIVSREPYQIEMVL